MSRLTASVWNEPNWSVLSVILVGLATTLAGEVVGILRHDEHQLDTISEIWWSLRARLGPWSAALALPLALVLSWAFYHLTFEGRRRDAEQRAAVRRFILASREAQMRRKLTARHQ